MPTKYNQLGVSLLLPSNKIEVKCRASADCTGQFAVQAEGLIWLHSDFSGLILVKLARLCHQTNAGSQFYWAHVNSWSFSFIFVNLCSLQLRSAREKQNYPPDQRFGVSLYKHSGKRNRLFVSWRTELTMYYVRMWRAVLNLLSQRNSARYIGVHFVPGKVLQSVLRWI